MPDLFTICLVYSASCHCVYHTAFHSNKYWLWCKGKLVLSNNDISHIKILGENISLLNLHVFLVTIFMTIRNIGWRLYFHLMFKKGNCSSWLGSCVNRNIRQLLTLCFQPGRKRTDWGQGLKSPGPPTRIISLANFHLHKSPKTFSVRSENQVFKHVTHCGLFTFKP